MSTNWIRYFDLQVIDDKGIARSFSDFKVTFRIDLSQFAGWRVGMVKIYNLNADTQNKLLSQEYKRIKIIAGYQGNDPEAGDKNYGLIFSGDIRFTIAGRENPTDTFTLIQAIDGHEAIENAVVTQTLNAGYNPSEVRDLMMGRFNPYGVTPGLMPELPTTRFPRGKVFYGMAHDYMSNLAKQCRADWQVIDGQATMVPENNYVQDAVVLNSSTGLVGMPEQTMNAGVNLRCLINSRIKPNGLIHIDQASIVRQQYSTEDIYKAGARLDPQVYEGNTEYAMGASYANPASIAADGVYIVKTISYTGDTRGNPWYMDLMCIARGERVMMKQSKISQIDTE